MKARRHAVPPSVSSIRVGGRTTPCDEPRPIGGDPARSELRGARASRSPHQVIDLRLASTTIRVVAVGAPHDPTTRAHRRACTPCGNRSRRLSHRPIVGVAGHAARRLGERASRRCGSGSPSFSRGDGWAAVKPSTTGATAAGQPQRDSRCRTAAAGAAEGTVHREAYRVGARREDDGHAQPIRPPVAGRHRCRNAPSPRWRRWRPSPSAAGMTQPSAGTPWNELGARHGLAAASVTVPGVTEDISACSAHAVGISMDERDGRYREQRRGVGDRDLRVQRTTSDGTGPTSHPRYTGREGDRASWSAREHRRPLPSPPTRPDLQRGVSARGHRRSWATAGSGQLGPAQPTP